jgi:membrane protein YqaA with SNARE-associated domain
MEDTPALPETTPQKKNIVHRLYDWVLSWAETRYGTPALFGISFLESAVFPVPPDVLQVALSAGKPKRAFWYATVNLAGSVSGAFLGFLIGYMFWSATQDFFYDYVFSREAFAVVAGDEKAGITRLQFDIEDRPDVMDDIKNFLEIHDISPLNIQRAVESATEGETPRNTLILATHGIQEDNLPATITKLEELPYVISPIVEIPKDGLYHEHGFWAILITAPTPIPYKLFTIAAGVCELSLWTLFIASVLGRGARFYLVAAIMYYFGPTVTTWIDRHFNWMMVIFAILVVAGLAALKLFV